MHSVRVARGPLAVALKRLTSIVVKTGQADLALTHVLVQTTPSAGLRLSATDLSVAEIHEVPVSAMLGRIDVAVPARQLGDIVRALEGADVSLELKDSQLVVSAGRARFSLDTLPATEFPTLPDVSGVKLHPVRDTSLCALLDGTLFSASHDETRYNLMGSCFEPPQDGRLRAVSSDGHRLSIAEVTVDEGEGAAFAQPVTVPVKGLEEVRQLVLLPGEGRCSMGCSGGFFVFRRDAVTLAVRLIDSAFPDYRALLPAETAVEVECIVGREALLEATERVALLAHDTARTVRLTFAPAPGSMTLLAVTPQVGEAREEVEADVKGAMSVGVNSKYLVEALRAMDFEKVRIRLLHPEAPIRLGPYPADGSFEGIIMPIRV